VLQSLLSSPYRIRVPAPATPLRSTGPLIVPVSVTSRQDAACAEEKAVSQMVVAKNAVARQKRCIAIAPKIVLLEIAEIWSQPQGIAEVRLWHKADMQLALMKAAVEGRADMFWKCRHFRL
jgi:hypothetical protein